mgnify:FL=1
MRSNKIIKTDVMKYLKTAAIIFVLLLGGGQVLAAETENLLSVEFNNEVYIPDSLLNSSAECKLKNGYLEISPNWANTGYKLKNSIKSENKWYSLAFRFKIKERGSSYQIMLSEAKTETDGTEAYRQFGILRLTDGNRFMIAGKELGGMNFQDNKWYLYNVKFNPYTTEIKARISLQNSPSDYAEYNGTVGNDNAWGSSIPIREYDTFKFTDKGTIDIADINISVSKDEPIYTRVTSAKVGNIFSENDEKMITAEFENVLTSTANANISYEVFDENGNVAERKSIGSVTLKAGEKIQKNIKLGINDFGIYKTIFKIDVNSNGESFSYSSSKFALSVADKLSNAETGNPKMKVNIPYIYDLNEWEKLKGVITDAGITGVRKDLTWYDTEPSKGNYISPNVTCWYEDAEKSNISNTVVLSATNPVYNNGIWANSYAHLLGAGAYAAWEKYVTYCAVNYQGLVTDYEILNEPNWNMSAQVYADYLKRANRIIKKFDKTAKVTGFVTGSVPWNWIENLLNIIKDNPSEYLDVLSVHPYDFDDGDYKTVIENESWGIRIRDDLYLSKTERLRALMQKYNCGGLGLNISEMAITSTTGVCSPTRQAAELAQLMTIDAAQNKTDSIYWYCLENTMERGDRDYTEYDIEGNYGLVGNKYDIVPFAAKPSYLAACAYNKIVGGGTYVSTVSKDGAKAYRFKKNGRDAAVLWSEETEQNICLDLGVNSVSVYDKYGNKLGDLKSDNGKFSFNAEFEPMYITGNFSKFESSQNEITISKDVQNVTIGDSIKVNISDSKNRVLRAEILSANAIGIKNINSSAGTTAFDAEIRGTGNAEEALTIKLYDNSDLVYAAKTHFMSQSLTLNKLKGTGINDFTINTGTTDVDVEIFAENVKSDAAAKLITAYYANDGTLMQTNLTNVEATKRGVLNRNIALDIPNGCYKIKFYLFGSEKNIVPYSKPLVCYTNN